MKRIHLRLLILTLITTDMFSQDISGKWYTINRSGLIEIRLTNDTLETRALHSDFRPKGFKSEKKEHSGIYKLKDKFLVVLPNKDKENQYTALTIFHVKDRESAEIAANGNKAFTRTIDELIKLSSEDTTTLYGITIYSEHHIPA